MTGLRIGLVRNAGAGLPVGPEISDAVASAAAALDRVGARVEPVESLSMLGPRRSVKEVSGPQAAIIAGSCAGRP